MKVSHLLGASAFAAILAASAVASAAVTIYQQTGIITSSTCWDSTNNKGLTPTLAVGQASNSVFYYAGANLAGGMTIVSPGTGAPTTTATGSATSNTCLLQGSTGKALAGSSWIFACHTDTLTSHNPSATLTVDISNTKTTPVTGKGQLTNTNNAYAYTVQTVDSLYGGTPIPANLLCSFTTNGTWTSK